MKPCIIVCILFFVFSGGYAQPAGNVAIGDVSFDAQFAKRPVPVVTGKLLHISPDELKKTVVSYTLVTFFGQVKNIAQVSADGSFRLKLAYPLPYQQIWLSVGDLFYAGVYANKDLHVELDIAKIKASGKELDFNGEGVRYLGTDGPMNVYMNDYVLFRRPEQQALSARMQRIPRSRNPVAVDVLAAYGSVFDSLKMIQDDYTATHPSPYAWLLENERMSEYYGQISVCYWGYTMENTLFDKLKKHTVYLISNNSTGYYRYLSTYMRFIPANSSKADWHDVAMLSGLGDAEKAAIDSLRTAETMSPAQTPYTAENTRKWTKQLQPRIQKIQQEQRFEKSIYFFDSVFVPSTADIMKLQLNDSKDIAEQKSTLEQLLPGIHTNWCSAIAKKTYAQAIEKIAAVNKALSNTGNSVMAAGFGKQAQQTAFGASLYKVSNMKVTDFLANLRKSFAGKAIVFDLWATWCGPCLGEMPHSKELQQHSKDLPVVFVYVCTSNSSDEGKWKRKIGELKLPGIHFFIDEKLDAELSQYFSFSGYPGYAFIDRNGVYKAGAIKWISDIKDRAALAALVN
jgi:thiol-disulfide isomerase/thioredoxin